MSYPVSHKTVVILDESNYFLETSCDLTFDFDVINRSRQPSGIIPLCPISKTLWTCCVEAIAEYCRIVWDIFPNGERLIRLVVCGPESATHLNDWNPEVQSLQNCMQWLAKCGTIAHLKANQYKPLENCQIINGFHKAIEALSMPTQLQQSKESSKEWPNKGRIVCISAFSNDSHIKSVVESVKDIIIENNELISKQRSVDTNCQLMPITNCELVFINTFPIEDQSAISKIIEIPKHQLNAYISSEVHSVKSGRFLAAKLSYLVLNHYDLASTTVSGIPMKEEQNASSSANYDVEIVHSTEAHTDSFRSGLISDGICNKTYREGFTYDTISLKWCTPRTNAVELHYCTGAFRFTSVDVNSRPSSCLTNFLLSGRTVMLEMPRARNSKLMSHMLSSHCGELYIHTLGTGRSTLEDPPSISEGSGGRVTDYRINDFGEMMKKNRLVPCRVIQSNNKDVLMPIEKAKQSLVKQTIYWPLVIGHTILFNIQMQFPSFLSLIPKEHLTEEEVLECKKAIYHLMGMENKGTNLPVPTIGIKGKGPKREELYRMLWNEMEFFVRSYCVTPEHQSVLSCLLECRSGSLKSDTHLNSASVTRTTNSETNEELTKKPTNGVKSSVDSEWAFKELNWARHELKLMSENQTTNSKASEPHLKKFKSNVMDSTTNGSLSLLSIWTNKLNEENSKKRLEFAGRTNCDSNIAKLYVNLNESKNDNQ
ncbi:integrator complex subunit 13-like [Oppia nitens]|uniref:integrator complex subunit 13-like n=1 Tax=Oppia nitens TaxID=1686743 RepID=UPI0023DCA411|nr:integrator complex subunit 13-like [Oppia nitens]